LEVVIEIVNKGPVGMAWREWIREMKTMRIHGAKFELSR
jgi:hypothetical protein